MPAFETCCKDTEISSGQGPGASTLTLLAMRTALRMGDPAAAAMIGEAVAPRAVVREQADFNWMLGSAYFLTRRYADAAQPLRVLFRSRGATPSQRAAAAYGLCGAYSKTGNGEQQLRYALWLSGGNTQTEWAEPGRIPDLSIYWAPSGWDLRLLLDNELPIETLQRFIGAYPTASGIRAVKYSIAVRLSRENRYEEAAQLYRSINANRRAARMERLGSLYEAANRPGMSTQEKLQARYELAAFIAANPDGIYFNDAIWHGLQRYALQAATDTRLTRNERQQLIDGERALKDNQEERWRAYLILRDCVREAGPSDLGRKAATLALQCLRGIRTDRFGREQEIRQADVELSQWLRMSSK
ncbi:MAG TPA: hypothetical protein VKX49_14590 [Bryobacteraceae bacterium]|nr:hypothetical protein [Bryobacteraceae bacterium]